MTACMWDDLATERAALRPLRISGKRSIDMRPMRAPASPDRIICDERMSPSSGSFRMWAEIDSMLTDMPTENAR